MRVYEFSKQCGISSKELLTSLKAAGFEVGSHMSVLTDQELDFLRKKFITPPVKEGKPATAAKSHENGGIEKKEMLEPVEPKEKNIAPVAKPSKEIPSPGPAKKELVEEVAHAAVSPSATVGLISRPTLLLAIAQTLGKPVSEVILTLLKWGILATKNQLIPEDVIARLATYYQVPLIKPVEVVDDHGKELVRTKGGSQISRPPVVVVMGHVDHGKTSLLDFIRKTRVAAREKGGITQHIGAYDVHTPQGSIIFIDTPGHEAFSKMRMRGAKVADIAILVVAADDSVKPQTIEAIKHARTMNIPVIVAVNKIDKVDKARLEIVKRDLANQDLLPEEWGGQTIIAPISAKVGTGIDHLLDMIILQAQMLELGTNINVPAAGYVLESKLEKGRGPVATAILQQGIVAVGDFFICGQTAGKISSLTDASGSVIKKVGPEAPVQIAGFATLPEPGSQFQIVTKDEYLKARAGIKEHVSMLAEQSPLIAQPEEKTPVLLIKTDTNSSKEALLGAIQKLSKKLDKKVIIIKASIGDISESDITLATNSGARIIGLHTSVEPNAYSLAQKYGVVINLYDIIYKLLESLEIIIKGAPEVVYVRTKTGEAVVRRVFDIKGLGVIAGCYVKEGRCSHTGSVVIWRGSRKIGEGKIKSLQRDRKSVKEVHAGYECAFLIDGFTDWAEDDRVECFIEEARTKTA